MNSKLAWFLPLVALALTTSQRASAILAYPVGPEPVGPAPVGPTNPTPQPVLLSPICTSTNPPANLVVDAVPSAVENGMDFTVSVTVTDSNGCLVESSYVVQASLVGDYGGNAVLLNGGQSGGGTTSGGQATLDLVLSAVQTGSYSIALSVEGGSYPSTTIATSVFDTAGQSPWPATAPYLADGCTFDYYGVPVEYLLDFSGVYLTLMSTSGAQLATCVGIPGNGPIAYPACGLTVTGSDPFTATFYTADQVGDYVCGSAAAESAPTTYCDWMGLPANTSCNFSATAIY